MSSLQRSPRWAVLLLLGIIFMPFGCSSGGRGYLDAEGSDDGGMNRRDMNMPPRRNDLGTDMAMDLGMDLGTGSDMYGSPDMVNSSPNCVNGVGRTAFRFRYEDDTGPKLDRFGLPDNSNWKVKPSFYSKFADSLYGGGFDLNEGNNLRIYFSLDGITAIRAAKLSVRGRSYSRTDNGSLIAFSVVHATDVDTGINSFSHEPPYQWHAMDFRSMIAVGDDKNQIEIDLAPGDDSKDIIVNSVELCLDADGLLDADVVR